ncbi:MAG TPA: BlaI/MecI/CopY family transcriptional regulator [Terriglobales bacterium]|nr:BlaI/MecI/CopY family transcriptional regulator [Terriglobales bacterium]
MSVRLSKLEFAIMETLWAKGRVSVREVLEGLSIKKRPSYNTVQTMVYRLEAKGVVNRIRMSTSFHMFEPAITREAAQRTVIDELLAIIGGESRPVMTRLIETGKMTKEDIQYAEKILDEGRKGGKRK